MRVQNKLLFATLALVLVLILATGFAFYHYSESVGLERTRAQMQTVAGTLALQLESRVQQMDSALLFLISEPDFLSAISYYTMPGSEEADNQSLIYRNAAIIRRTIKGYTISKNFYRAVLFTSRGDYFDSRPWNEAFTREDVLSILPDMPWLERASAQWGRMLLLPPHENLWEEGGGMVYSVVRALPTTTGATCYLEIQTTMDELTGILHAPTLSDMRVAVLMQDGETFYSSDSPRASGDELLVFSDANRFGLTVRISQSRETALVMLQPLRMQVVALCAVAFVASAAYLYFASRRLTKPIRAIRQTMEQTALETLDNPRLPTGGDELKALSEAFGNLCERLKLSMDAQMLAQEREARARFDALQAQADPHFLYNTLNVIAGRAMTIGDEEIVDTCEEIAAMLRYSADTRERTATIGREAAHLTTYLALMKKRYRQKLEYTVEVAPEIARQPMPKLVLQQFSENAIRHGLAQTGRNLCFTLRGTACDGRWRIEIADNGAGFAPGVLAKLRETLREDRVPLDGLSIGGMGIANTYARLRAFYGAAFEMNLFNAETGARITLSAPLETAEKEENTCE